MKQGLEKVVVSVESASKADEALVAIMESVMTISSMTSQIAASAEEQSQVSEEINKNVISISQVTEDTVQRAEDSNRESDKLLVLAENLDGLVSRYRS